MPAQLPQDVQSILNASSYLNNPNLYPSTPNIDPNAGQSSISDPNAVVGNGLLNGSTPPSPNPVDTSSPTSTAPTRAPTSVSSPDGGGGTTGTDPSTPDDGSNDCDPDFEDC